MRGELGNWYICPNIGDIRQMSLWDRYMLMDKPSIGPYVTEQRAVDDFFKVMDKYCIKPKVRKIWLRVRNVGH